MKTKQEILKAIRACAKKLGRNPEPARTEEAGRNHGGGDCQTLWTG